MGINIEKEAECQTISNIDGFGVRFVKGEFRGFIGACIARSVDCMDECGLCGKSSRDQRDVIEGREHIGFKKVFTLEQRKQTLTSVLYNPVTNEKFTIVHKCAEVNARTEKFS